MGLKEDFFKQFSHPTGWLGHFAGWLMRHRNTSRLRWGVEKLRTNPDHDILEIGFGPGSFIEILLREHGHRGGIFGIDLSEVMYKQASRRNRKALENGQLLLQQASVEAIPFDANRFDRVYTSNTNMFWPNPVENMKEIARVMKPDGLFCLSLQPYWIMTDAGVREEAEKIRAQMQEAGFRHIETDFRPMKPIACMCLTATL
jgi:ubiquinone/menaquinone biosynthesis C-methylase UbiE